MEELELQTLNSIVSEEHKAPGRKGWHPCEKSHGTLLPGFTCSHPFEGSTKHSAWGFWTVTSILNHSQGLIGTQDLSMVVQNPQLTGLAAPSVRMILGTYPSEPVPISALPGSNTGSNISW